MQLKSRLELTKRKSADVHQSKCVDYFIRRHSNLWCQFVPPMKIDTSQVRIANFFR